LPKKVDYKKLEPFLFKGRPTKNRLSLSSTYKVKKIMLPNNNTRSIFATIKSLVLHKYL